MKKSDYDLMMTNVEFCKKTFPEQEDILNKLEERISELSDQEYENPTEKGGKLLNILIDEYDDFWSIMDCSDEKEEDENLSDLY